MTQGANGSLTLVIVLSLFAVAGAWIRYWIVLSTDGVAAFPLGILLVNVLGSFAIGVFSVFGPLPLLWRTSLTVGFLGALTTFSSFSLDTVRFIERGEFLTVALNVTLNNALSIGLCYAGTIFGRGMRM